MRISVGVKSRPSTRVWNLPWPPNKLSTTWNTRVGSNTIEARAAQRLDLHQIQVGGNDEVADELAVRSTRTGPTEISTLRARQVGQCAAQQRGRSAR